MKSNSVMITELIDYRSIPRVSNSDLTRLKEEFLGTNRFIGQRALQFGRAFHSHLLEPESVGGIIEQLLPDLKPVESGRLEHLTEQVRRDSFCRRYLRKSERERVVLFTDPLTELACKARLDMVYTSPKSRHALILDFKTTSARTQSQFLQSCYDYDYDRQAAFYIDGLRHADSREWDQTRQIRFILIGVQKQKPHRLFAIDATSIPDFVEYGRKKYRFWLRKWNEQQQVNATPWLRQAS
ncbi:PD-(D/E)XK nuclease-like domain-containing protein [Larkinella insperata]|uniref:PD-(D/E)XK nuclease-like domain-containing protein n=1 Tax=Larkinella insperata TaxID=332158 RepID=A0ABW3QK73_9BACT|nr:PD-(D/E)XK nuclease-like domain-containing protein [Larkinella insperata]